MIDGDRIVDANRSFLHIAGYRLELYPRSLSTLLPDLGRGVFPAARDRSATETRLIRADGQERPVEILARPLDWRGAAMQDVGLEDSKAFAVKSSTASV